MKTERESPRRKKIAVLIADDKPVMVKAVIGLLRKQFQHVRVCGISKDAAHAVGLVRKFKPDIVIVDLSIKGNVGVNIIRRFKRASGKTKILVFTASFPGLQDRVLAFRAMHAGASGFLRNNAECEEFLNVFGRVLAGECAVGEMSFWIERGDKAPVFSLTEREHEVYYLIGLGLQTKDIAQNLGVSTKTIESFRIFIKEKLGLKKANDLTISAFNCVHGRT